jgi:1-acyl-sn-glycerol-3-phosphate acyltransferase
VRLARGIYGGWFWLVGGAWTLTTGTLIVLAPGRAVRRHVARLASRGLLHLLGMPVRVEGLQQLPEGPCIIAANHASYLDGIVLTAALPPRFSFVIKREVTSVPFMHLVLRRLGAIFVERFNSHGAGGGLRQMIKAAREGQALGIFPEGTFTAETGIREFRMGTFMIAVRTGLPVAAVAISGTRRLLPAESFWPRPGQIRVRVTGSHLGAGTDRASVLALREAVRDSIVAAADEPDLLKAPLPEES